MENKLNRFTACYALVMNVEYNHIRGFAPVEWKMLCIYVAHRTLGVSYHVLAAYYRVSKRSIEERMEDVSIQVLIDEELNVKLGNVRLYWELVAGEAV